MKKNMFLALLFGLLLSSCSKSESESDPVVEPPITPDEPVKPSDPSKDVVTFVPTLGALTRATETRFEAKDEISVFAMHVDNEGERAIVASQNNFAHNIAYVYNGVKFTPKNIGIEKTEDERFAYAAVYPYVSNASSNFEFVVNTNQANSKNYTQSDLCTAAASGTAGSSVNLKFDHRLSRIIFNLVGDGWANNGLSATLKNARVRVLADLNNLNFEAQGATNDITCVANGTKSFAVIIPPQIYESGVELVSITSDGKQYAIKTSSRLEFRSGKSYEYTISMDVNRSITEFTGDINPWNTAEKIDDIVPKDIQDKMEPYIPIYKGTNPPNIEGTVFVDPFSTIYCEDYDNGGYAPGDIVNSQYIRFSNQNSIYNTIDIDEVSASGSQSSSGTGAFISGTGNNFTAFFNTEGQSSGIITRTALVISGTKTSTGIANLKYAFVMVEKGADPEHHLMNEGVFRVFEDQDGISNYTTWPGSLARSNAMMNCNQTNSIFSLNK